MSVTFRAPPALVHRRALAAVIAVLAVCSTAAAQEREDSPPAILLRGAHPWLGNGGHFSDVQRVVRESRTADTRQVPYWSGSDGRPTTSATGLLAHVTGDWETSRTERADAVRLDSIVKAFRAAPASAADQALLDIALDIVAARHAFIHRQGRIDPSRVHAEWSLAAPELDLVEVRSALIAGTAPADVFSSLEPQTRSYAMLVHGLAEVRRQDADTSEHLPAAPSRPVVAGGRYAGARALARVLVRLGELPHDFPIDGVRNTYTKPLATAIERWQNRKLKKGRVSGTLTAPVLATLLAEYAGRGDRIAMAIERWRWLPRDFSNDPLVVNLPEYRLHSYSRFQGDSADPLSMNVVIGRADSNATPVFSANMTQVVFSPRWHVPKSIMLGEIGPAAARDSTYLDKHNYELTTPRGVLLPNTPANIARIGKTVYVRQRSGDDNSLGKVKFLLPNPYDIYLHDTPSRSLFSRNRRDFSHGCVRLGNPMAMARYVLGSQPAWTDSKITEAMNAGIEKYVRVPRPIPVLIVYQTAVADPDGALRYFNDVYGHDRTLSDALDKVR
ncbi:MAG: L,D-transpeptidase family protein [Gemmatimonadaceae bacterium]|nr:L,D-transpeptidase family protein [Gemmatimonadaceae bacterium]